MEYNQPSVYTTRNYIERYFGRLSDKLICSYDLIVFWLNPLSTPLETTLNPYNRVKVYLEE